VAICFLAPGQRLRFQFRPTLQYRFTSSVVHVVQGLIEFKGVNPFKSHDPIMLYGHVDGMIELEEDTLAALNQIYIDARYPASLGSLPGGLPTGFRLRVDMLVAGE
jgi:hypothetical protein